MQMLTRQQRQSYIGKRVENEFCKIGVIVDVFPSGSAHVEFLDYHGQGDYAILVINVNDLEPPAP